ncbi:MAG: hypothetical protein EXS14_10130 [Planctomycetes bacterium]|nr:hypothetical protein [Planctomycetota bacterium]
MEDSKAFVLYLNITSKVATHPDQGMLQTKGGRGFPHVVVMDSEGEVLTTFRPSTQAALKDAATKAQNFIALRTAATAKPGDADANVNFIMAKLGMKEDVELRKKLDEVVKGKISPATRKAFDAFVAGEKIKAFQADAQKATMAAGKDNREATTDEWAIKAYKSWKGGLKPPAPDSSYLGYALSAARGAQKSKAKADAEEILKWIEGFSAQFPQITKMVEDIRAELEAGK